MTSEEEPDVSKMMVEPLLAVSCPALKELPGASVRELPLLSWRAEDL